MNRFLFFSLILTFTLSAAAREGFSSLEEQMTGREFTSAGLQKLSAEELETLNNWIRNHSLATLDAPRAGSYSPDQTGADERGFEVRNMAYADRTPIKSRIKGTFTGWDGNAVFELDNGMIWEQADNDTFYIRPVENPAITIEPGTFRTWRLSVDGYASECRVERIQ